jgi:excisionase family DNA binding protein
MTTSLSIPPRNRHGSALPRLLSVDSVAAELDVSTKTVRRWISTERLPTHRLGRQIRISEADLLAFIAQSRSAARLNS